MVGKIIGYTLLSILLLIVAALFVKIKIHIEYSHENTNLQLGWLFLKIPLFPRNKPKKTKAPKEEKPKKEESAPAKQEKPKKAKSEKSLLTTLYEAEGIDGIELLVRRLFRYLGTFFGELMRSFVVTEFYLDISCTKNDAAETALYYGEVCSALFPMLGALVSKCRVKKYDINIYPDFIAKFSDASFVLSFYLRPSYLIGITVALICKLVFKIVLQIVVKIFSANKKNKTPKNENTENIKEKSEVVHE